MRLRARRDASRKSRDGTGRAMRERCGAGGTEREQDISADIIRRARKYPHMKGSSAKRGLLRGRWDGETAQSLVRRSKIERAVPMPRRVVGIVRTAGEDFSS